MILQDNIKIVAIKGNIRIIKKSLNIKKVDIGKEYFIPINNLSKGSHYKIKVECDFCDYERELSYREYLCNTKKDGKYYCSKCSVEKMLDTKKEKYGENYEIITQNYKNVMLNKYGVENCFQLDSVKEKSKKTNLEKYGDENYRNLEKHKETIIKIYGVDNVSKSDIIKEKKIETCLKNFGVKYPTQSKNVCMKISVSINKNRIYNLDNMRIYRYKVTQLTLKNKKELLYKWTGYDYYDGEYIKDNLILKPGDSLYPTIDHKISIFYGFINNISIDDISHIDNLCITKRNINSSKNKKCEDEFKNM